MPQGKGTYGSQVGRPPKKQKKYQEGGEVDQNKAILDAAMKGQELKSISLENIPTENAPDRMETSPDTTSYDEGGPVKDILKSKDRRLAKTPPKKGGGYAQSAKQKEEHRVAAEKAKKRIAKEKMEYGRPKKKKKWEGRA